MSNYNVPKKIMELTIKTGIEKVNNPLYKTIILGIFAGAFVAFGAESSSLAVHGITDAGIAKTVGGAIFTVGLMMIVIAGGELFTGNCLIITSVLDKKIRTAHMLRNLVIIYISNFIGASLLALAMNYSGQFHYSQGGLGAYVIKTAVGKAGIDFQTAFISGILCNILVCVGILMAYSAKDIAGKCIAIFFPIWAFAISGFEHCVANMYYFTAGILAANNETYLAKAMDIYDISSEQIASLNLKTIIFYNMLPVTIGNFIGGAIVIGAGYYLVYGKKQKDAEEVRSIELKESLE